MGAAPRVRAHNVASARVDAIALPYLPGSLIPLQIDGLAPPYSFEVVGPGRISSGALAVSGDPRASAVTLLASGADALAMHSFALAEPPLPSRSFVAVASYDAGVVIHDARGPFSAHAVLGIGGAPSDVAIDSDGTIAAANTSGDTLTLAHLMPWSVQTVKGVMLADEVQFDPRTHALYATDRDVFGAGALTRVTPAGDVVRRTLGVTSEGVAIDVGRHRIYVANANDGTISIVDSVTMAEIRRFRAIDRAFSLALSADGTRLYAVSNQSISSLFSAAGRVVAFDVSGNSARSVASSPPLAFPVGIAFDREHDALFVTDERDDVVYVFDPRTLRARHAPIATCRTPWKPAVDVTDHRLYVPCAQADRVDVIDTRTLRRIAGAPFATGGYPLAVAVWHAEPIGVR